MIELYYTRLAIVDVNFNYAITNDYECSSPLGAYKVPLQLTMVRGHQNPLDELKRQLESELKTEISLKPSKIESEFTSHQADPKNWPSQDDDGCTCGLFGGYHDID
jgi:hypothetical protein